MSYTKKNLNEVEDMAAKNGMSDMGEARFARTDLDAGATGLAYHRLNPGKRQGFGHKHENAEEVHVVIAGSGRVRLDDEIVELNTLDALRLAPEVTRSFEAGPDGMDFLVFGPHHEKDGELLQDFWKD
jgi:mannose-6-phosphate isomerase-like protein (cupin superfamily)